MKIWDLALDARGLSFAVRILKVATIKTHTTTLKTTMVMTPRTAITILQLGMLTREDQTYLHHQYLSHILDPQVAFGTKNLMQGGNDYNNKYTHNPPEEEITTEQLDSAPGQFSEDTNIANDDDTADVLEKEDVANTDGTTYLPEDEVVPIRSPLRETLTGPRGAAGAPTPNILPVPARSEIERFQQTHSASQEVVNASDAVGESSVNINNMDHYQQVDYMHRIVNNIPSLGEPTLEDSPNK